MRVLLLIEISPTRRENVASFLILQRKYIVTASGALLALRNTSSSAMAERPRERGDFNGVGYFEAKS